MELKVEGVGGYVTIRAAAAMMGVTDDAILWRIKTKQVDHLRLGKAILVSLAELRRAYTTDDLPANLSRI